MAPREPSGKTRVWLVAGMSKPGTDVESIPEDRPVVRDHLMRTWDPGKDNNWHTRDGRHHATWTELHSRYDLVEVA